MGIGKQNRVLISDFFCTGFDLREFQDNLHEKDFIKCEACREFSSCDEIFYHFSHTKTRISDEEAWCCESRS